MERVKKIFEICKKFLEVNFEKTLSYLKKNSKFYLNKKVIIIFSSILFIVLFFLPIYSSAYQIKFTKKTPIEIGNPKSSTVYFGEFKTGAHTYKISSDNDFLLHVDVFTPDTFWQKRDIYIKIFKNGDTQIPIAYLDPSEFRWTKHFDSLIKQNYWQGPAFEQNVGKGDYDVVVSSSNHDSKYFVRFGNKSHFNFWQMTKIVKNVSTINKDVYQQNSANFIFSFFGIVYVLFLASLSFLVWFVMKIFARKVSGLKLDSEKTKQDKMYLIFAGVVCVIISVIYVWSPFLIFISGVFFCEGIFPLKSKIN